MLSPGAVEDAPVRESVGCALGGVEVEVCEGPPLAPPVGVLEEVRFLREEG